MEFTYYQPTKIHMGPGFIQKLPEIVRLYGKTALLIGPESNPAIAGMQKRAMDILQSSGIDAHAFFEVETNPSSRTVDRALAAAHQYHPDVLIGLGGGSSIDTAKLVGLMAGLDQISWDKLFDRYSDFRKHYDNPGESTIPVIAIPTTSGTGSQCTQACVITHSGKKLTVFHQNAYARHAILDPELTMTLPPFLTACTAFDAFTHCFESYMNNEDDIISRMMAERGMKLIAEYLPKTLASNQIENREKLMIADTFGGISLANHGAGLPHPISEVMGGYIPRLSHGYALAMVYPAFLRNTCDCHAAKYAEIMRLLQPESGSLPDQELAELLPETIEKMISAAGLEMDPRKYQIDRECCESIRSDPIWDHLRMESAEVIRNTVDAVCDQTERMIENEAH